MIQVCIGRPKEGGRVLPCEHAFECTEDRVSAAHCDVCGRLLARSDVYGREAPHDVTRPIVDDGAWYGPPPVVYFARASDGRIKIGTSRTPSKRRNSLASDSGMDVRILATTPGSYARERELHAQFAAHRLRGEWFAPAPELLAFIETLKAAGAEAA